MGVPWPKDPNAGQTIGLGLPPHDTFTSPVPPAQLPLCVIVAYWVTDELRDRVQSLVETNSRGWMRFGHFVRSSQVWLAVGHGATFWKDVIGHEGQYVVLPIPHRPEWAGCCLDQTAALLNNLVGWKEP